jgi:hypothetical protein
VVAEASLLCFCAPSFISLLFYIWTGDSTITQLQPFKLFCPLSSNKNVDADDYTILLPLAPPDGAEQLTAMLSDLIAHNISSEN